MDNHEVIMQITLLAVTAFAVHISLSPPNPCVKSEDCCSGTKGTETLFERIVMSITFCSKSMVWFGVIVNIMNIAVTSFWSKSMLQQNPAWLGIISPVAFVTADRVLHPMLIVGASFTVFAAALRMWCFKSLGPLFTFQITIRPHHQLVMHGPYAWVRHPSYTGVYFTLTGATLALAAPGTWTSDSMIWSPLGSIALFIWIFKCLFAFRGMIVRFGAEDEVLRITFGDEWEEYATRVPCKFIPGVV